MNLKKLLLATTTIVGVATVAATGQIQAAEVKPLGALDVNIGGFARWYAFFGDLKDKYGGQRQAGTYDFRTDTEVFVYARGKDEATGLEYGGNIELEADTNNTADADEAYVFVKGKFGEFRFGDQNGVIEQMIVGAVPLGAFSGGLDGVGPLDAGALAYGVTSDDSTKVVYYSPTFAGFQLGLSLTPSTDSAGNNIKTTNGSTTDIADLVEPGITYTQQWGEFGVLAAVTGGIGRFSSDDGESRDFNHVYGGLDLTFGNFSVGGGYGRTKGSRPVSTAAGDDTSDNYLGNFLIEPGAKQSFYNLGGSATFGPATVSLTYGQTLSSHVADGTADGRDPEPTMLVGSLALSVAPGLVIGTEVVFFENHDNTDNNDGILGLAGIRLAF